MKMTITYGTAMRWFNHCEELLEIFQNDTSLTMEIEWALLKNYRSLSSSAEIYNSEYLVLQGKYDLSSDEGVTQLSLLNNKKTKVDLVRLNHNILRGLNGVSLEVMALFDFMIT